MVAKLLGDPTYFPIEFRRWLKDFLDNADLQISPSQITGGGAGGGSSNPSLLPAGIILPYATTTIGKDCLLCNGAAVSRTDYAELFTAIGVAWGNGDGSTTFNVPDLRDRGLWGIGSVISLAQTDGRSLGNRGGPTHHHNLSGNTGSGGSHNHGGAVGSVGDHAHGYVGPASSGFIQQGTAGSIVNVAQNPGSSLGTNNAGAHGHSIGTDAGHQHSLSGVQTTGGYDTDRPSFAGVQFAVTTGRSAVT